MLQECGFSYDEIPRQLGDSVITSRIRKSCLQHQVTNSIKIKQEKAEKSIQ